MNPEAWLELLSMSGIVGIVVRLQVLVIASSLLVILVPAICNAAVKSRMDFAILLILLITPPLMWCRIYGITILKGCEYFALMPIGVKIKAVVYSISCVLCIGMALMLFVGFGAFNFRYSESAVRFIQFATFFSGAITMILMGLLKRIENPAIVHLLRVLLVGIVVTSIWILLNLHVDHYLHNNMN